MCRLEHVRGVGGHELYFLQLTTAANFYHRVPCDDVVPQATCRLHQLMYIARASHLLAETFETSLEDDETPGFTARTTWAELIVVNCREAYLENCAVWREPHGVSFTFKRAVVDTEIPCLRDAYLARCVHKRTGLAASKNGSSIELVHLAFVAIRPFLQASPQH
jgi:hypothetical protein